MDMTKNLKRCVLSALSLAAASLAHADVDTQQLIAGYGTSNASQQALLSPPPSSPQILTLANNSVINQFLTQPLTTAQPLTLQGAINTLTTSDATSILKSMITDIPAPLVPPKQGSGGLLAAATAALTGKGGTGSASQAQALQAQMANFDINSLLGPLTYQTTTNGQQQQQTNQQQTAQNFITLVSGTGNPLPVVDFTQVSNPQVFLNLSNVQTYLGTLRTYAAQVTMGLGNLYQLYAERVAVQNLGTQAGVPQNFQQPSVGAGGKVTMNSIANPDYAQNMSPLAVRKYLATRRLMDPSWGYTVQNATPAEVQKETLLLLAEMRAEMFNEELALERLNASLSVIILQNATGQRQDLQQQVIQINRALQGGGSE